jgi:mRNA interferase RelE/StbE
MRARKAIRIIYRIVELEVLVEVVAIGKREDMAVYREAVRRLLRKE